MLLIMCYSVFRIKAYTDIKVDLKNGYFEDGMKTKNSKERTIPIHSAIYSLVSRRHNGSRIFFCLAPHILKRSSFKITSSPSLEVIRHTSPPI